jgi:hypothetical protein
MEITVKAHHLIILVIIAVAAYMLWKRMSGG